MKSVLQFTFKKKKKSQIMIEETCLQIVLLEGKLFRQRMFCIVMKHTVHFVFVFQKKKRRPSYILTFLKNPLSADLQHSWKNSRLELSHKTKAVVFLYGYI